MNRVAAFLSLACLSLLSTGLYAQVDTASLGTGATVNCNTCYPAPYGNWFWGSRHQMLIRASELNSAGIPPGTEIYSLGFNVSSPAGTLLQDFEIRMRLTADTVVTSNFVNTGWTTVWGAQDYAETAGWNDHNLASPFFWDGTSNILIETCFNNTSFTNNAEMFQTPTSFNSTVVFFSDAPGVCSQSTGDEFSQRPDMRFSYLSGISVTATDTILCSGDTVPIQTTVINNDGPVSYSWEPADSLSCDTCATPLAFPAVTDTYKVIVTDTSGSQDSATAIVTVFGSAPNAIAGPDTFVCQGDTVQLSATGGTGYLWQPSNGLNDTSIANPIAFPSDTTLYEVTVSNPCGSDKDTVVVDVIPLPTASVGPDTTICQGDTIQLNGSGGVSYSWSPSTGLSDTAVSNPLAYPIFSIVYELSVADANGCSDQDMVNVNVSMPPSVVATTNRDTVCPGGDTAQLNTILVGDNCEEYRIDTIPFNPVSGSGTSVSLFDDQVSAALPIGFDFEFYCNTYNQFYISSNGFITFTAGFNAGCCSGQFLPNTFSPNNLIAFAWEDLDPGGGAGTIEYFTAGVAPNRILVMNFIDVPHFAAPDHNVTAQVLLYEGSNIIEIHTTDMPSDGGNHTMGLENDTGNIAHPVAGRNSANWSASNEGIRFTPGSQDTALTYSWDPASTLSNDTIPNPVAQPTSTTSYVVSVHNECGMSQDTVTVYVDSSSTNAVASPDTFVCQGDAVQLSATGGTGYLWQPSNGLNDTSIANPIAFPSDTTLYEVTVSNLCSSDKDTVVVDVLPSPAANAGTDTTICQGDTTQLTGSGGVSYSWSPSTGLSDTAVSNPLAYPAFSIVYELRVTGANGCSDQKMVNVNVNMPPNVAATTNRDTVCPGGDTAQLNTILIGDNCEEYRIDTIPFNPVSGSGTSVSLFDDQVSAALPIGFDFEFYCNPYNQFYISSNGFITFNSGAGSGCCSGQFLPSTFFPNNLVAFAWEDLDPGGGAGTIEYFTAGSAPNRILVMNFIDVPHFPGPGPNNDVTAQVLLYEGSNIIEIHTTDMPSNGGNHTMGLENDTGNIAHPVTGRNSTSWSASNEGIRFTPGGQDTALTYSWTPASTLSDDTIPSPVAQLTSTTSYVVNVGNECGMGNDTVTVFVDSFNVTALPGDTNICKNTSIQFNTSANTNVVQYDWSPTSGLSNSSIKAPIAFPNDTTTYTVEVTNLRGCQASDTLTLSITPLPMMAEFAYQFSALTVNFVDSSSYGNTYRWDFGDGNADSVQYPTHTYNSAGTYTVCQTAINDCGTDSTCQTITVTGVAALAKSVQQFTLYPNPSDGRLNVHIRLTDRQDFTLRIVDVLGREVARYDRQDALKASPTFDLSYLAEGIYFVYLQVQNKTVAERFVLTK